MRVKVKLEVELGVNDEEDGTGTGTGTEAETESGLGLFKNERVFVDATESWRSLLKDFIGLFCFLVFLEG